MRLTWPHLLLLLLVVLILFGATRLPDVARNLGKSMKIMKSEIRELRDEPVDAPADAPTTTPVDAPVRPEAAVPPQATPTVPTPPASTVAQDADSTFTPGGKPPNLPRS